MEKIKQISYRIGKQFYAGSLASKRFTKQRMKHDWSIWKPEARLCTSPENFAYQLALAFFRGKKLFSIKDINAETLADENWLQWLEEAENEKIW